MSTSMDLPVADLISIRENQIRQHKINFQALKSVYEIQQGLLPPTPQDEVKKTIENMKQEQQAVQILEERIKELRATLPAGQEKNSISA